MKVWHKNDTFIYILNNISENITLVQLMDSIGNVNHDISIVGHWIFDSNYEKALFLKQESLDAISSPSVGEEQVALLTLHTYKFTNIIDFSISILKNRMHIKGGQRLRYNLKVSQKNDAFYILKNISEYVTLIQIMDSLGNFNCAISIVGCWVFDSNYEKATFSDTRIIGCNIFSFRW